MAKVKWESVGAEFRKVSRPYKGPEIQPKNHKESLEGLEHGGGGQ